jgi:uncharacterized protein YdcH (DUF465 family)
MIITRNISPKQRRKGKQRENGGHEMDKNFERLFDSVEKLRTKQTEKEQTDSKISEVRKKAISHFNHISEEYREQEDRINEKMERAETENQENKERIVELTTQQLQAEIDGKQFDKTEELDRLRADVTNYPLKVEAMARIREGIVISSRALCTLEEYEREWQQLEYKRNSINSEIQSIIADIAKNDLMFCSATTEIVPGRRYFLPDDIKATYDRMRKEDDNE